MAKSSKSNSRKPGFSLQKINNLGILALLSCITLMLYWPVQGFEFTNWDDQVYITENPMIRGLSGENIQKIFTEYLMGNYHPLVLLSYALEYELYGLNPGIFHLTNLLLHLGSGLILFFCLLELSFSKISAGILALLFLIHPFHVESVAWVTERKDVLYGIFWLAAWYAWLRSSSLDKWFGLALVLFILSCLSKGMAVTLPAALILGDWIRKKEFNFNYWKKYIPFLLIAIGFGILAVYAQKAGGNVRADNNYGIWDQIRVAAWGIWFYLSRTLIPFDLSLFYEYPDLKKQSMPWQFTAAFIFCLIAIPLFIYKFYSTNRLPVAGLMLFLLVLFPVSQVFPVGNAIAADRYHYIPSIGLFLLIGWGIAHYEKNKLFMGLLSLWILGLLFVARERIMIWKNPEILWNATIKQNPEIMFAYKNLAKYLEKKGRIEEAEKVYRNALQQDSLYAVGWNELGVMLKNKGKNEEAYTYFIQSVALDSINKEAWLNIGTFHDRRGETDAARIAYQKSIAVDSNYAEVWNNYANSLSRTGSFDSADVFFQKAIRLNPGYAEAYNNRGTNFALQGKLDSARICLLQAIEVQPNYAEPQYNLAHVFLQLKQTEEGIAWMRKASQAGHPGAKQLLERNGM